MDIKRIKYDYELINNRINLRKKDELFKQKNSCNHIRVVLNYQDNFKNQTVNNSISYCLICGRNLSNIQSEMPIIDGTFYKRRLSYLNRLIEIRKMLLDIKEKNPSIPDKILVDLSQQEIDKKSEFITNGYNEKMILARRINNINL